MFNLRPEARWSNGDPVTAHDFVFSLRRGVDPKTLSVYSYILTPILNADEITAGKRPPEELGVRAIDDHTLEITLANPTPYFLGLLAHSMAYPVHRATLEAHGDQWTRPGNLVGNGAFMLDEWVVQSHVKVVRNPYYWDNANTKLEEVWFHATEDLTAELQRFRALELDMTEIIPAAQIGFIRENLADELVIAPYLGSYYYGFNVTRPPFKDNPKLRRALSPRREPRHHHEADLEPRPDLVVRLRAADHGLHAATDARGELDAGSSARPRPSASTPKPATGPTIRCARRSCTTRRRTTAASPSRSRRCGSRCSASKPRS